MMKEVYYGWHKLVDIDNQLYEREACCEEDRTKWVKLGVIDLFAAELIKGDNWDS